MQKAERKDTFDEREEKKSKYHTHPQYIHKHTLCQFGNNENDDVNGKYENE